MNSNDMLAVDNYLSCLWVIHNGEKQPLNDNAVGMGGSRGRTAFGFKVDGSMVIVCTDDKSPITLSQTRDKLFAYGCINGIILDGGGSSQIDTPDEDITSTRIVSNFVCVWVNKTPQKEDDTLNIIQPNYKWAYSATLRTKTDKIVLHHVGAKGKFTPEQIHAMHLKNKWRGIAYNFYVRQDGSVYHGREENAAGGHTEGFNLTSIGICFEGNFEVETMPDAQLKAGRELIAYLRAKYPDAKTVRHSDLNKTACPGKNFPFDKMTAIETSTTAQPSGSIYRVQVGSFTSKASAEALQTELNKKGYQAIITEVKA